MFCWWYSLPRIFVLGRWRHGLTMSLDGLRLQLYLHMYHWLPTVSFNVLYSYCSKGSWGTLEKCTPSIQHPHMLAMVCSDL